MMAELNRFLILPVLGWAFSCTAYLRKKLKPTRQF